MAVMKHSVPGPSMTRLEIICGVIYLPIYLIGLSLGLNLVFGLLNVHPTDVTANLWYFALNFLFLALMFAVGSWPPSPRGGGSSGRLLQAVVLGFALYYALTWLQGFVFELFSLSSSSPNDTYVDSLINAKFTAMAISIVVLAPFTEEILFRGVIFGNLRRPHPLVAYIVSVVLFAVIHVGELSPPNRVECRDFVGHRIFPRRHRFGLDLFQGGCPSGASMTLHAILNGIGVGLLQLEGLG